MKYKSTEILEYWKTLYPEVEEYTELNKIFESVLEYNTDNLIDRYIKNENLQNDVHNYVDFHINSKLLEITKKMKNDNPFLGFYLPIINKKFNYFYEKINSYKNLKDTREVINKSIENIIYTLSIQSDRTLILEVNISRLEQELKGETSVERFKYFKETLLEREEYLYNLYDEYFELTKLMSKTVNNKLNYIIEIISNIDNSRDIIQSFNSNKKVGKIVSIDIGKGDDHNQGKSVAVVSFEYGFKIVYKPKKLEIEYKFQEFIDWINSSNIEKVLNLYKTKIYYSENFGLMEHIDYEECKSKRDVKNYYLRIGQLMAVLYTLNAQDFHHENIIARGEHPILVDLESLFHFNMEIESDLIDDGRKLAESILGESVYSIGLLPQRITNQVDGEEISVEISGLGCEENQTSPFKSYIIKNDNTDYICLDKALGMIEAQINNPKLSGRIQKSDLYVDYIKIGFTILYKWILDNKEEVKGKVKEIFAGSKSRYIIRPTYLYAQLLRTSLHPDFLRSNLDRDIILARIGINADVVLSKFIKSEFKDLRRGDIPYFICDIDTGNIIDSGNNIIKNCFDITPIDKSLRKIDRFNEEDLQRQLYFIDISFLAKSSDAKNDETGFVFNIEDLRINIEKNDWLSLASEIGDYILSKAIEGDNGGITWISTVLAGRDENIWGLSAVGNDLYLGNCGISLFLAYLGTTTRNSKYIIAVHKAMKEVINEIEKLKQDYAYLVGAYNGLSGYVYTLFKIGKLLNREDYVDIALSQIDLIENIISKDKVFDVIGGAAGSLGVILSLYEEVSECYLKEKLINIAYKHFDVLDSNAKTSLDGRIAWESDVTSRSTGFSHGNSGIIANLIKLYSITNDENIINLIKGALRFERSLYSEKDKNWYMNENSNKISVGWCHGAPGILLSRAILKNYKYIDDELENEITIAINTVINKGFSNNLSLCHGDLGNLEILMYVAKVNEDLSLQKSVINSFQKLFTEVLSVRWDKGIFRGTEALGLMLGLAGVGYSLVRYYNNCEIPNVLLLN